MSKESTPELTKSWVFVDQDGPTNEGDAPITSGIQEVAEPESHVDSDTDSISVISESGCSYKTDEEECTLIEEPVNNEIETIKEEIEPPELEPPVQIPDDTGADRVFYFTTSLVCALVLVCVSCAIQRYLQAASNINKFDPEQEVIFSQLKNQDPVLKEDSSTKFTFKKIKQIKVDQIPKIAKLEEDDSYDNGANRKYDYKMKQKHFPKCESENCEKRAKHHDENTRPDEINDKTDEDYEKKIKELRIKEDYLREKEKFLIEREHALLKKEMKLNKEKQHTKNKHDKKAFKREKEYEQESSEEEVGDKSESKTNDHNKQSKSKNKKHKFEDKKKFSAEKRKFFSEQDKKRNISGQWYINLHEARDNMRQKKYAYFKRNKAHWYFQWMVDRARLRGK